MITALVATAVLAPGYQQDFSKLRGAYSGTLENVSGYTPKPGTKELDYVEKIHIYFIRPKRYHMEMPGAVIDGFVEWKGDELTLTVERVMDSKSGHSHITTQLPGLDKARSKKIGDWASGTIKFKITNDLKRLDLVTQAGISKYDFYFRRRY